MTKWRVYLGNQHAQCRIYADGRTRREAFRKAFNKARPEFRHYVLAGPQYYNSKQGTDVMWLAAFMDAMAYMRPGTRSATHSNPKGLNVEIRRL
jgi:hypothetical protein